MSQVMIMAGGTGGHVFPGLAVAESLRRQGAEVVWVGTRRGLEARLVPAAGIAMEWITIQGLRGRGWHGWLLLPLRLSKAMWQSWRIIRRRRPDVVLALGGFVSGPGAVTAWLLRKPLVIHEQNAVPGLTNRLLAVIAKQVLSGFPGAFSHVPGARHVGNPVRPQIAQLPAPEQRLAKRNGPLQVLVVGGSQGSRFFNNRLPQALAVIAPTQRPLVRHQCGANGLEETQQNYRDYRVEAEIVEFIDDMTQAYLWADLVICRAGAMTVAELAAAGMAAILVPYPHAVDDHQSANAAYLAQRDAALLVQESELSHARLAELLQDFAANRTVLLTMAQQARACAVTDAATTVAALCLEAANA